MTSLIVRLTTLDAYAKAKFVLAKVQSTLKTAPPEERDLYVDLYMAFRSGQDMEFIAALSGILELQAQRGLLSIDTWLYELDTYQPKWILAKRGLGKLIGMFAQAAVIAIFALLG